MKELCTTTGANAGDDHLLANMKGRYTSLRSMLLGLLLAPLAALAQPANDNCSGAIELIPGATCDPIAGTVEGATPSQPGTITCDGFGATPDDDVWYRFTATSNAHQIRVVGSASFDAVIQLLTAPCDGTPIICRDLIATGGTEVLDISTLTPGTEYLIRVFHWQAVPATTPTFTICVGASLLPANDECAGAIELTPAPTCAPVAGTVSGATQSAPAGSCGGFPNDDVWYKFTATAEDHTISVTTPSGFDVVVDIRASCGGAILSCADVVSGNSTENLNATGLTIGETYFVRLYHFGANLAPNPSFTICVLGPEPVTCDANAGTLTNDGLPVCLDGGSATISATADGNSVVPVGYETLYVLTQGSGLVIVQTSATPEFTVTEADTYTIHTLIYDPTTLDLDIVEFGVTTGFDVNALLVQGGGSICASLDVAGAAVSVEECVTCEADAGTLASNGTQFCLVDGSATFDVVPNGNAVVPAGYDLVYVLTKGPGLVIVQTAATPAFTVTEAGAYTVHTLVYDPATLDLSIVEIGVTTGFDVNALLIQGGGSICASLDVVGAAVAVEECVSCDANAGTITADLDEVCYVVDETVISATPDGNSVVPVGFETVYVLTEGPGLVIVDASSTPEFLVAAEGSYTIHTLIYDPTTLDLGIVEFGVTTGFDVNALLIQGGGSICASLDVVGAAITVQECVTCDADAGTITADQSVVCFVDGMAMFTATDDGNIVVPDGFMKVFVLTQGAELVIIDAAAAPDFMVTAEGNYTIHTLVYDPTTLDLGTIEIGVTTGFDVNALLIQGGGAICASLDVTGAPISVVSCTPANDDCINATALIINAEGTCGTNAVSGDNTYASQDGGVPSCDETESSLLDVWYTFNSGSNTAVTITFDPGTMTDWAIVVSDACDGNELACEIAPLAPFEVTVSEGTTYWVRVYSNLDWGMGGNFTICLTGAAPTLICDGGDVTTTTGSTSVSVCQDEEADVIDFTTNSTSVENYAFILTDENNAIITALAGNALDFNSAAVGVYHVWGVSYNGDLENVQPGTDIGDLTSTGECIDLSNTFTTVTVELCMGVADADQQVYGLYPNPTEGSITLTYRGADAAVAIAVMDASGRVVMEQRTALTGGQRHQMDLGNLAPGLYTVRLSKEGDFTTMRVIVR